MLVTSLSAGPFFGVCLAIVWGYQSTHRNADMKINGRWLCKDFFFFFLLLLLLAGPPVNNVIVIILDEKASGSRVSNVIFYCKT